VGPVGSGEIRKVLCLAFSAYRAPAPYTSGGRLGIQVVSTIVAQKMMAKRHHFSVCFGVKSTHINAVPAETLTEVGRYQWGTLAWRKYG
jgi:hypothetical protein